MWLTKKYPLPTGMKEFESWSDRIISKVKFIASKESLKFVLADQICALPSTVSSKEDGYFVDLLHKYAANQIATAKREEIRNAAKARLAKEEADKKALETAPTPDAQNVTAIR